MDRIHGNHLNATTADSGSEGGRCVHLRTSADRWAHDRVWRIHASEEPDAGILHVRICGGPGLRPGATPTTPGYLMPPWRARIVPGRLPGMIHFKKDPTAPEKGAARTPEADRFEKRDGHWKTAYRIVVFETTRLFLEDVPPIKPDWVPHRRDQAGPRATNTPT